MKKQKYIFSIALIFTPFLVFSEINLSEDDESALNSLPADQRASVMAKMIQADTLSSEITKQFEEVNVSADRPVKKEMTKEELEEYRKKSKNWIYGYEVFTTSPTTFAPATDIPISPNYVLGPGDQVKIQSFGGSRSFKSEEFISRNGDIVLENIGPISLTGLTLEEAKNLIQRRVGEEMIGSNAHVSLGELRSNTIYILGAAYQPGAYKISSLSNITNALFVSGGVDEKGSVRNIEIKRGGKTIHTFDLYKLLLQGDTTDDMFLQEGDTIFIPLLEKKARVYGSFRRPHLFEIKEGDTIRDLISYAGGITNLAKLDGKLELTRLNKNFIEVKNYDLFDESMLNILVRDGDSISVQSTSSINTGVVELKGEFKYPGIYNIKKNEKLSSLIERAGGLNVNAYTYGAVFTRTFVADRQKLSYERNADYLEQSIADAITSGSLSNLSGESLAPLSALIKRLRDLKPSGRQVIEADPLKIKSDPRLNFSMQDGDTLYIPGRPNDISIVGEVLNPSSLSYKAGDSALDYIENAGGLKATADKNGIFLILPNGESQSYGSSRRFTKKPSLVPGSIIVIPRDPEPFNWLILARTITPILADTATAIATVEALLD